MTKSTPPEIFNTPLPKLFGNQCHTRGPAGLNFLPPGTTINEEKKVNLLKSKLELCLYECPQVPDFYA